MTKLEWIMENYSTDENGAHKIIEDKCPQFFGLNNSENCGEYYRCISQCWEEEIKQ